LPFADLHGEAPALILTIRELIAGGSTTDIIGLGALRLASTGIEVQSFSPLHAH
jgi:hypothetical protein